MSARDRQLLHPIPQMTTWELKELRSQLEEKLSMETLPSYVRSREELSKTLADVIEEQDERAAADRASRSKAKQADA